MGLSVLWECAVLELTDALKQTIPTCASRNIRKTVWRIYISILELKSWGTCFFSPRVFSNNLSTIVVLVSVNEGIIKFHFLVLRSGRDILSQTTMDVLLPLRAIVTIPIDLSRRLNIACNLKSCYLQKLIS